MDTPPGFFVTGSDTGCGKTAVSLALIAHYQAQGERVVGMKPIASGAEWCGAEYRNEDARQLQAASSLSLPYAAINPYCFAPAIAPHIAAEQAGVRIELESLCNAYHHLAQQAERVIVEGAGGLLVPLNRTQHLADLIVALKLPVVLVIGLRLGCINHALLTCEVLQQRGIAVHGWIANQIDPQMEAVAANLATLRHWIPYPHLGTIPHLATPSTAEIMEHIQFKN